MGFDNMFDDAQADADALRLAAQLGAAPVKPLEYFLVVFRWDSIPMVFDPEEKG